MAEVRKKIVEDKYNTSKIKKVEKKSQNKNENDNKVIKHEKKDKSFIEKIKGFFHGVKLEFKRVHWTSKKDMIKYSVACIFFIIFCSVYFYFIDVIFALFRSLFA